MEPLAAGDPQEVGLYRLCFRLGTGGMGRVFLGFSPAGRAVAVKIIHPELARDPEFVRRVRHEVPGPSLAEVIAGTGPLPEAAVWTLVGGLAEALQAMHASGLVHRDLKPANVLIAVDGPRVIDFGISWVLEGATATRQQHDRRHAGVHVTRTGRWISGRAA